MIVKTTVCQSRHIFATQCSSTHRNTYQVCQIKWGQCDFSHRSRARFGEFWAGEITVHLHTFISIKSKYFSLEGATKANDFLCSGILVVLITHNIYIKMILLTNNFHGTNHLLLLVFIC